MHKLFRFFVGCWRRQFGARQTTLVLGRLLSLLQRRGCLGNAVYAVIRLTSIYFLHVFFLPVVCVLCLRLAGFGIAIYTVAFLELRLYVFHVFYFCDDDLTILIGLWAFKVSKILPLWGVDLGFPALETSSKIFKRGKI